MYHHRYRRASTVHVASGDDILPIYDFIYGQLYLRKCGNFRLRRRRPGVVEPPQSAHSIANELEEIVVSARIILKGYAGVIDLRCCKRYLLYLFIKTKIRTAVSVGRWVYFCVIYMMRCT